MNVESCRATSRADSVALANASSCVRAQPAITNVAAPTQGFADPHTCAVGSVILKNETG